MKCLLSVYLCLSFVVPAAVSGADSDLLLGVEPIVGPLPYYDQPGYTVRTVNVDDEVSDFSVVLPRCRYWSEDRHLELLVVMNPAAGVAIGATALELEFVDADGHVVYEVAVDGLAAFALALYPRLPAGYVGAAAMRVRWVEGEHELGSAAVDFRVEQYEPRVDLSGRISIALPNPDGVAQRGLPYSVGVPFPRGVVSGTEELRLVDASGRPIAAQIEETGRWSKYGSVKWVRVDFVADLDGVEREVFLDYRGGEGVAAPAGVPIRVEPAAARFPVVDAGVLRLDDGVWYRPTASAEWVKVLDGDALSGGFVEHEDGRLYNIPGDGQWVVEEECALKVVLRSDGWYREVGGSAKFCQYQVRCVIYRDSPVLRIFHTWVYTGDSDLDRIRNMGWQLPLAGGVAGGRFWAGFDTPEQWLGGDSLLQYDYDAFAVLAGEDISEYPDGRSPGVVGFTADDVDVLMGVRDFWQAFPSELELADGSLWFHSWPRRGREREPVDPATAALLRWAHQGEVLDLRLPQEYTEDPIDSTHRQASETERVWTVGEPSSVNAQGVARTEEFWLVFGRPADADSAALMAGLNDELLRAVVDPWWVIGTEVFYEAHPQDWENYPEFERDFERIMLADFERIERAGLYGMWVHGEVLWDWGLRSLYRALRKGHGGYGRLSWMPYARSGDPRLLKRQDAAMRRMIDANFCHYTTDAVAAKATGPGDVRRGPGFWARGPLPWAARAPGPRVLDYERQPHQWWSAWYMTDYHRARDMGLAYLELAKEQANVVGRSGNRGNESVNKAFIDTYEATFDPWLLLYIDLLGQLHRDAWVGGHWQEYGRNWMPGDRDYHRFTGCEEHVAYYTELVDSSYAANAVAYAALVSDDDRFARKLSALLTDFNEIGSGSGSGGRVDSSSDLPMLLGAIERLGTRAPESYRKMAKRMRGFTTLDDGVRVFRTPPVGLRKEAGEALPLFLGLIRLQTYRKDNDVRTYWVYGPDGDLVLSGDLSIGTFDNTPGIEVVIPAEAPAGVYWLLSEMRSTDPDSAGGFRNLRGLMFPVSPPGSPEVLWIEEERMALASPGAFHLTPGYYFFVPQGVTELRIDDISSRDRASIWNPDGRLVWENPDGGRASAVIAIDPEHQGKLWRIRGGDFAMDPQVPAIYSMDPDRWFDIGDAEPPAYPRGE